MSFLAGLELEKEANYTRTLNGAKTHSSTGDACLDFFSVAGGMRYRKPNNQIQLFERAYIENPELAMKLLFYIRDIRGGLGERNLFRTLIRHVAKIWPESAKKNVPLIAEYGRWDDLICLMGTPAQETAVQVIRSQLDMDLEAVKRRENGEFNTHISLLAKWLPSCNTSSKRTRGQAKVLIKALQIDERSYRKMLAKLRANSYITECRLTHKCIDKINYEAVPAGAMLKYHNSFQRNDKERFSQYIAKASQGKKKIHCDTLYPYEILKPFFKYFCANYVKGANVLEALWKNQTTEIAVQNAICVIDTSASMYWDVKPALISQALGLYYAERCQGIFHNYLITFESNPHLIKIRGNTLQDKIRYLKSIPWGHNTNLEAVFELILQRAMRSGANQEEMPSVLYIISDMEFDCAIQNPDKTIYDNAKKRFESCGYQLPAVVFHNVNSWQTQMPVTAHTKGTALTSGAGTVSFKHKFDGNVTPMSHMLKVLMSERYQNVHA